MATDKQIRLNVNDSELNKLRQRAEDIARDMIKASREFSTSGDVVIADLEEQIALMERRSRINNEFAQSQIQQARQAGPISPHAQQQIQAVQAQATTDKILVDLVRELIETTKQTSKDEIRADREDVERRIRASQTVGQLGPAGDPFRILQETLQQQYLGGEEQAEVAQTRQDSKKRDRDRSKLRQRVERTLNKAATAENEYVFLTSFLEAIPWVGRAAATVAARGISNAENFQQAAVQVGRQRLFGNENLYPGMTALGRGRMIGTSYAGDFLRMGFTPGEGLASLAQFSAAQQRNIGIDAGLNLLGAQRTLGVDQNTIMQLLTTTRYDRSINDPSRVLAQFDKYLRESGKAIQMVPEMVGTFTNAASQILSTRGDLDAQGLSALITNIASRTGFEGVQLQRTVGALGGLGRTANPVTRALLMRAFRETDPGASYVDIQERLEGGLSAESQPGLQRFFEIMRERTGGGDALVLALRTALPELSIKDIREVIKSGGFAKLLQREQIAEPRDFTAQADKFVPPIEASSKQIAGALELAGDTIVQLIDTLKDKVFGALEGIGEQRPVDERTDAEKENDRQMKQLQASPLR